MIRARLPEFQYGLEQGEDDYGDIEVEERHTQVLADGAQYNG